MSLKDEMLEKYHNQKVFKTVDQVTGDIKFWMQNGKTELFYDANLLTEELIEHFKGEGFTIEPYEDEHSKSQNIELMKISW